MKEFLMENYALWTVPMGILLGVAIHRIVLGVIEIASEGRRQVCKMNTNNSIVIIISALGMIASGFYIITVLQRIL